MTGYRTEIVAVLFTLIISGLMFTDRIAVEIGLGLITTQLAPLLAAARASRNTKRLDEARV